ncbi:right-handed parallel beta-helix repeat-containing protein [bacterium]|nr:right-handed parallel beta-helix repeat-containing protein [bacterium]
MKKYILLSLLSLVISMEEYRTAYGVSGNVFLENSDDHSGVQISFYDLLQDPSGLIDFTLSDENGYYEIDIESGYYLVEWTKDGYVPWEQGGFAHGGVDVVLDDVTLIPGEVITVSGDQFGNWTTNYQYWIDGQVTVPAGETLTIDAGVRVKFLPGAGMVCYGTLEANGTEEEHVLFTSKQPTPLPGDWDNIELYGENNIISYVDYEYADDGFTGDGASGSTFDHLTMANNLSLTANGIVLTNSSDMTFTNNQLTVSSDNGIYITEGSNSVFTNNVITGPGTELIYCSEAANSTFSGNVLTGTGRGIYANNAAGSTITNNEVYTSGSDGFEMDYCHNCLFDGNTVTGRPTIGIEARYSDSLIVTNNNLDVNQYGMNMHDGSYLTIESNAITNFQEYGIYFYSSENSSITNNQVISNKPERDLNYGIVNDEDNSNQNAYIEGNQVLVGTNYGDSNGTWYGIISHHSEIISNMVYVEVDGAARNHCDFGVGIYGNASKISSNLVNVHGNGDMNECGGDNASIKSWGNSEYRSEISDNILSSYHSETRGIMSSYSDIINNHIIGVSSGNWAIGYGSNNLITGNTITNMSGGIQLDGQSDNVIDGNTIQVNGTGINGNNANNLTITNNTIETNSGTVIYTNSGLSNIKYNLLISNSGRGIHCENQAGEEFSHNTIIGNGGDYGIHISNLSQPVVNSNIITGFQNGIYDENDLQNTQLRFNDLYNISNEAYSGTGLPVMIGNYVNESLTFSGDTVLTDIYGNMNANPEFAMPDEGNYELQLISPCINNGDPSHDLDPDNTVADIGAFYKDNFIEEDIYGCTDQSACNFNPQANLDNGDCTYSSIWYSDEDGDGLGWAEDSVNSCDTPNGYVSNSDDTEPDCATNDTDDCGVCGGENTDKDCAGVCFGQAIIDDCGICDGSNTDQDCNGECFGTAYIDGCSNCVGGNTGSEECPQDCNGVYDGDAFWDDCSICSGGNTDHVANSDMDCSGVCFGDATIDSFDGCCQPGDIDICGQCNGNGWDMCDEDGDGASNYDQWGYSAYNLNIIDVENDQGGWVNISFENSFFDTDTLRSESYTIEANYGEGWIVSASGGAYGSDSYIYQVHTQVDSTASSNGMIDFRIIASMDEGNFVSSIVSGYSVDNIVPLVPANLAATLEDQFILLSWNDNTDTDLGLYNIYRDNEFISSSDESLFIDVTVEMAQEYEYAVSAVDIHDNESNLSEPVFIATDLLGDINFDGIVNIYDIIIMVNCVLNDGCDASYDVNFDGGVNIYDIIILVNIAIS